MKMRNNWSIKWTRFIKRHWSAGFYFRNDARALELRVSGNTRFFSGGRYFSCNIRKLWSSFFLSLCLFWIVQKVAFKYFWSRTRTWYTHATHFSGENPYIKRTFFANFSWSWTTVVVVYPRWKYSRQFRAQVLFIVKRWKAEVPLEK